MYRYAPYLRINTSAILSQCVDLYTCMYAYKLDGNHSSSRSRVAAAGEVVVC